MNVPRGYEGAKNEAFLSLQNRQVPRRLHDPPAPFVTTSNVRIVFECRIRVLFAFQCKPGFTLQSTLHFWDNPLQTSSSIVVALERLRLLRSEVSLIRPYHLPRSGPDLLQRCQPNFNQIDLIVYFSDEN